MEGCSIENNDSDVTVVVFSALMDPEKNVFNFVNTFDDIKVNKIFLMDINRAWYYTGIGGFATNIAEVASFIEGALLAINTKKSFFVGSSSGGFAAILFGNLLHVDRVLSFCPQVYLDAKNRKLYKDYRWKAHIAYLNKIVSKECLELTNIMDYTNNKTEYEIHLCGCNGLDITHVDIIEGLDGFNVIYEYCSKHAVCSYLKEHNRLKEIINRNIEVL